MNRHVIALEPDLELYEEVLVPLLPVSDEVESESRQEPSSPQSRKRPRHLDDDEVEKKTAPKRKCK